MKKVIFLFLLIFAIQLSESQTFIKNCDYKKRSDFSSDEEYGDYIKSILKNGMRVRALHDFDGVIEAGMTGTFIGTNGDEPPALVCWDKDLGTDVVMIDEFPKDKKSHGYWVYWDNLEIICDENSQPTYTPQENYSYSYDCNFKKRDDFSSDDDYAEYMKSVLKNGMRVRALYDFEYVIEAGMTGTYIGTNGGDPPALVCWDKDLGKNVTMIDEFPKDKKSHGYWVYWDNLEIICDENQQHVQRPALPPVLTIDKIELSENILEADKSITLTIYLKNHGLGDGVNVYATISTNLDSYLTYPDKIIFPVIPKQGGSAKADVTIKANHYLPTSQLYVDIMVNEPYFNVKIKGKRVIINTQEFHKPDLQVVKVVPKEIASPNPDGKLGKNEQIGFDIYVQNLGQGAAENVTITAKNTQHGSIFLGYILNDNFSNITQTPPHFDKIEPGKYVKISPTFFINTDFSSPSFTLNIIANEKYGDYGFSTNKDFPVGSQLLAFGEIKVIKTKQIQKPQEIKIQDLPDEALASDLDLDIPNSGKKYPNRYALIIGVENYKYFEKVNYAINDAQIFKAYANKILGVPEDNILTLLDPTNGEIIDAIQRRKVILSPETELIFYYAGHGIPDENGNVFLAGIDATANNYQAISPQLQTIYSQFAENSPKRVLVFLDACYSGGAAQGDRPGGIPKIIEAIPDGNTYVISATTKTQISQAYNEQKHGLFTWALLKTLKESKGNITLEELKQKIEQEMKSAYAKNKVQKLQTPTIIYGAEVFEKNVKLNP